MGSLGGRPAITLAGEQLPLADGNGVTLCHALPWEGRSPRGLTKANKVFTLRARGASRPIGCASGHWNEIRDPDQLELFPSDVEL